MVAGSSVTLVIFQSSNWVWRIAQMLEISKRQIQTEYEMFDIAIHARLPHSLSGVGAISQIIITWHTIQMVSRMSWRDSYLVIFNHLAVSILETNEQL